MNIHKFHKISATIIVIFLMLHLTNHAMIIFGAQSHIEFMNVIRLFYRNIIAESILILCVFFQVVSGIMLIVKRKGKRVHFIEKLQVWSGLYLAFFLVNHVSAVFVGRLILELDTNIYFAIAGFYKYPFYIAFIPYYFLAVVSIFIHIACAVNWILKQSFSSKVSPELRRKVVVIIMIKSVIFSVSLMLAFFGFFSEIVIPQEYLDIYQF